MSDMHFDRGWRDRLQGRPERASYEKKSSYDRIRYERGRHCAALWQFYVASADLGTIHNAKRSVWLSPKLTYTTALSVMPYDLRVAIELERAFCAKMNEMLSVVR